jgi:hypothetical protein
MKLYAGNLYRTMTKTDLAPFFTPPRLGSESQYHQLSHSLILE